MAREETTAQTVSQGFADLVVAIGASAGALAALRTLLGAVRADAGAAFIVMVHRPPNRSSRFVELLKGYTSLRVLEAGAVTPLEPDTVIVVPPEAEVASIDTHLRLVWRAERAGRGPPIDGVFRALAAARGGRAVGVVLTGAGSDGVLGLRQIKDCGGLAIVQSPEEAEHVGMPRSAIETGVVDLVLPLRDMPAAIARYRNAAPQLAPLERDGEAAALAELLDVLEARTGRAFGIFARPWLARRIGKRMRVHAIDDWSKYVELLRADPSEAHTLADDLLQNASEFFADAQAFDRLEEDLLPQLFDEKSGSDDALRAWVVGCSTGEQVYSLAIALVEERARRAAQPRIQVFASDLGEQSLQRARLGVYPSSIEHAISSARLDKFFVREDGAYRVRPALRHLVVFARHDVVTDFPFSQLDLVVCRRALLENLQPDVREAVLRNFHYALRPQGWLVVESGAGLDVETAGLFAREGEGGVYRPVAVARHAPPPLPPLVNWQLQHRAAPRDEQGRALPDARVVHLALLERYTPASVLVDTAGDVVHYSERAGRFLRLPGGELSHELVRLLREPLRSAVRGGLDAVARTSEPWTSDTLLVHSNNGVRRVTVHVDPATRGLPATSLRLVVFEETEAGDAARRELRAQTAGDLTQRLGSKLAEASRRLEALMASRRQKDFDSLAAGRRDGELARAFDDLENAKEELRGIHEELVALDHDNRTRIEDLGRLSADLEVLLESTGLATLFLDADLKIVRFTPPLLDIVHAVPGDDGRPFAELEHRLRDDDLVADADRVVKHQAPTEREVEAENGKWYLMRMFPYRSAPQGLGGVAITFVDITKRKQAEQELRNADRRKDEFIALLAHELRNPLAPISSGIEILKRRDLDPALADRVTLTMSRQAAQLVRLIDDLLDVSRISSGRLRLKKKPVALADVVRDAVAAVRPLIERAGHTLEVDVSSERIVLDADAARLTQVVANLLNNAARYTPSGGTIEIGARREGNDAVVTVKDSGYGIPENALPHVFEMFYQGADPRSATQTGLGIGLALAKSLVDMHGGTIGAVSAGLDRGSEFTVRLPVMAPEVEEQSAEQARAVPVSAGHRVLVVDDNADAAQMLAMLIRSLGSNDVHVALSGEEALPLAERIKPDTVFLDLKMPEMDGYEVAQRLRRQPWAEDAWLVALTGWALDEHKRRTKEAGFDQHLTKPADRAALESILGRPAAGRH